MKAHGVCWKGCKEYKKSKMEHFTADLHAFYSQTHPFSAHASLVKQTVYHFCLPPKGVISPNCKNHDFKQVSLSSCTLDVNVFG